mmetsp:Transcript_76104/g.204220  ORF Transcript_76104/g.204220 Transcript_76104/m.204220 type:complete len:282 (+) Transcript_76104:1560-2405(+)
MPAFMPTGASLVILMLICSSPMGNCGCGSDVIHTRNSGSMTSASLAARRCSSSMRNLMPRWQFCSSTQQPVATPWSQKRRATTSCPWPMDTDWTSFFFFLARPRIRSVGSDPMDSTHTKGVRSLLSACVVSRLSGLLTTYFCPSASATYSLATIMVRSGRSARMMSMRCILSSLSSKSGTLCCSGASRSFHCFHCWSPRTMASGSSLSSGIDMDSCTALSQLLSVIQLPGFLRTALTSSAAPPLTKQLKWSIEMVCAWICTFMASRMMKTSLCRSKRPRPM